MKKQSLLLVFTVALSLFSLCSFAQDAGHTKQPKWVSNNGTWVIESNVQAPLSHTIYFYNNDQVLVYKEEVNGMKIKTNKRKVLLRLKNVLDQSVIAWQQKHISGENENIVALALRK